MIVVWLAIAFGAGWLFASVLFGEAQGAEQGPDALPPSACRYQPPPVTRSESVCELPQTDTRFRP